MPARRKPKTQAEFFQREREAWQELNALVTDLPEVAWREPGAAEDWSLKDVWAHLAAWMQETRRAMPMLLRGERVSADIEAFNREHYGRDRDLPLDTVLRRVARVRGLLLASLKRVPEENLLGNRRVYIWASYATYNHYAEHVRHIVRFRREHLPANTL